MAHVHPVLLSVGSYPIHSYGVLRFVGDVVAWIVFFVLVRRLWLVEGTRVTRSRRLALYGLAAEVFGPLTAAKAYPEWSKEKNDVALLFLWIAPLILFLGRMGGRFASGLEQGDASFALAFWQNPRTELGLCVGAAIAVIATVVLARRGLFPFWRCLDAAVPALLVAMAIHDVACFMAGCCSGTACEGLACVTFPPAAQVTRSLLEAGVLTPDGRSPPLHPVQLYSAFGLFAVAAWTVFGVLRRGRLPGQAALLGLLGMFVVRLSTLPLRAYASDVVAAVDVADGSLTDRAMAIWVSWIVAVALAALFLKRLSLRERRGTLDEGEVSPSSTRGTRPPDPPSDRPT